MFPAFISTAEPSAPSTSVSDMQTNSGIGEYEYSDAAVRESPEILEKNENRISGATLGKYLEDYYTKFVQDRATSR